MNPKTSPQHRAEPNEETVEAEFDAVNWHRMTGTVLPGPGAHRKQSVTSAHISLEHGMALAGILPVAADESEDEVAA